MHLGGLTELSDQAIGHFAEYQGSELLLSGVSEIADDGIVKLSKMTAELSLSGLTDLSNKAASALEHHDGILYLNGLATLSDEAAVSLASHEADVYLESLEAFPNNSVAASRLAKKIGALKIIVLGGLLELDSSVAEILAKERNSLSWIDTQVDFLDLSGITELSPKIAGYLSFRRGDLMLSGLSQLPEEVSEQIAEHRGRLSLEGLESLSEEAALKLVSHNGDIGVNIDVFPDSVSAILHTHPSLFPIDEEDDYDDEDQTGFSDSGGGDLSYHRMYLVTYKHLIGADIVPAEFAEWLTENLLNNEYYNFCEELFDVPDLMEQWDEYVPNYPCPDSYCVVDQHYMYVSGETLQFGEYYFGWTERPRRVDYKMQATTEQASFCYRSF